MFTKNTWIEDSGTSCYITNDDTGIFDVEKNDESVQGSSGNMNAMKKCMIPAIVWQGCVSEKMHTQWPIKYCARAGTNLFSLTWNFLEGSKLISDAKNGMAVWLEYSSFVNKKMIGKYGDEVEKNTWHEWPT